MNPNTPINMGLIPANIIIIISANMIKSPIRHLLELSASVCGVVLGVSVGVTYVIKDSLGIGGALGVKGTLGVKGVKGTLEASDVGNASGNGAAALGSLIIYKIIFSS